jgi:hypothetical protein
MEHPLCDQFINPHLDLVWWYGISKCDAILQSTKLMYYLSSTIFFMLQLCMYNKQINMWFIVVYKWDQTK